MTVAFGPARRALDGAADDLIARRGVMAVGVGTKVVDGRRRPEACVTVFVRRKLPTSALRPAELLPAQLGEAVPTDVLAMEPPFAPPPPTVYASPPWLRGLWRPAPGGVSAAHFRALVGTLAAVVVDAAGTYLLSCNHVFGGLGAAAPGDPILQPSPADGGTAVSTAGWLARSAPLRFDPGAMNVADASLAWCPPGTGAAFVAGAGAVAGVRRRALVPGDPVHKVGRTTGLTFGTVLAVHATVAVDYSWIGLPEGTAWYREQIVTSPMSAYGDSGALLLDAAGLAAGLLFGGSLTCTLFNPINAVLEILGVALPAPEGRS